MIVNLIANFVALFLMSKGYKITLSTTDSFSLRSKIAPQNTARPIFEQSEKEAVVDDVI